MTPKILAIAAALPFFLAAKSTSAVPNNSEFKIGISQEFETLNPLIMSMSATSYMARLAVRTLVVLDANSKWIPQLAKAIPSIENGMAKIIEVDGTKKIVTQWEILENASWGDGKPVTCEDFRLALKIASSPHVSIGEKETYTQIEKIEWDPKTPKNCTFTFTKARWDFFKLGSFFPVPKHIEEPVFKKYGSTKEGYEKNSVYTKKPTTPGLYNGPYLITEVNLGDHLSFGLNPHFYGSPAKIKKIIFKLIPNTGTLEANLRSGTIDMISTLGLALDQAIVLDKKVKAEKLPYEVLFTPSVTYEHIDLNLENSILKDPNVRKALLLAMNRDELALALFEGRQQTALHFVSPKDPWFTSDSKYIQSYKYSRNAASKLLNEAGWVIEPDGIRAKGGKKLNLSFMTTAGNKTRELVQVYLQEQWKQVGIDVTIKNEPARVFFSESAKKRKYGALAMFAWVSSPETIPRPTLHSKSISTEKNGWSGQNWMSWINPQVDKNIEDLEVEFNPQKRLELARAIQKAYSEDVPVLPLYYRSDITVVPKNLKNFRVPGHQYPETNEVETWTLE